MRCFETLILFAGGREAGIVRVYGHIRHKEICFEEGVYLNTEAIQIHVN
jgi:hypothetical protein